MQAVSSPGFGRKDFSYALTFEQKVTQAIGTGLSHATHPVDDMFDSFSKDPRNSRTMIDSRKHPRAYLADQDARLRFSISRLTHDISQLRTRKDELKTLLSLQRIGEVGRLQAQVLYSTTKSEDLGVMRQTAIDNAHSIEDLRDLTSPDVLDYLRHEIKVLNHEVISLRSSVSRLTHNTKYVRDKIEEFTYSELYDEVSRQRRKIAKLRSQLSNAIDLHSSLKQELSHLESTKYSPSTAAVEYIDMQKRLHSSEERYLRAQAAYIKLRETQITDISQPQSTIHDHSLLSGTTDQIHSSYSTEHSLSPTSTDESSGYGTSRDTKLSVLVRGLPADIDEDHIRTLFSIHGPITRITISHEHSDNNCVVEYAHQSSCLSAVSSLDGHSIDSTHRLTVTAMSPSDPPSPSQQEQHLDNSSSEDTEDEHDDKSIPPHSLRRRIFDVANPLLATDDALDVTPQRRHPHPRLTIITDSNNNSNNRKDALRRPTNIGITST